MITHKRYSVITERPNQAAEGIVIIITDHEQMRQDAYHNGDYTVIEHIIDAEIDGETLSLGHEVRKILGELHYIDPGHGAVEYAAEHVAGLTREEAASIVAELFNVLPQDGRVKRCRYCGYPWRDTSLRNTKHTCSDECKTAIKTIQRRQQRADEALLKGKTRKKTKRDVNYVWWLEYPFWLDEYEMLKQTWKHEASHDLDLIDFVHGQNEIYGEGNRRKRNYKPGAEDEEAGREFNAWTRAGLRGF